MTEVNMERIAKLVGEAGYRCYVEQTGGGVATIFAGTVRWDTASEWWVNPIVAGPGIFTGPNWTEARADTDDFYVGWDNQGEGPTWPLKGDEVECARRIVQLIREVEATLEWQAKPETAPVTPSSAPPKCQTCGGRHDPGEPHGNEEANQ